MRQIGYIVSVLAYPNVMISPWRIGLLSKTFLELHGVLSTTDIRQIMPRRGSREINVICLKCYDMSWKIVRGPDNEDNVVGDRAEIQI